jgi:rRNA maturation protein Nop10
MKKLMKCVVCGNYTLSNIHCNKPNISPHPVASGVEKNIRERLKMRLQNLEKKELEEFHQNPYF